MIKYYIHSLSTYFRFDPFKSPFCYLISGWNKLTIFRIQLVPEYYLVLSDHHREVGLLQMFSIDVYLSWSNFFVSSIYDKVNKNI